jgi:hypothetical protein
MGKAKEKAPVKRANAADVACATPLVEDVTKAKARLAKVRETLGKGGTVNKSDPKHRQAKKRVKRAQRRLREALLYAATRPKKAAPAEAAAPAAPAAPAS